MKHRIFWGVLLGAILFSAAGCSHQPGVQASGPSFASEQDLPFERASDKAGLSPTASLTAAEMPRGTPITVRVESPVSSASSRPGEIFHAVLDVPIVVDEKMIAPSGSAIAGKVVEARAASAENEFGFVRLTLTSISLDSKNLPIQTANIFVKGAAPYARSALPVDAAVSRGERHPATKDVEFPAERRLTFRLTQTLSTQH